jgi:citrate synthase
MVVLNGETYLDGNEACKLLGVKAATLYAYVSRGVLKSYKQGIKRQRLYKKAELEALLQLRPSDAPPVSLEEIEEEKPAPQKTKKERPDIPAAEEWIPYF